MMLNAQCFEMVVLIDRVFSTKLHFTHYRTRTDTEFRFACKCCLRVTVGVLLVLKAVLYGVIKLRFAGTTLYLPYERS